jgi:hypothetical protein
MSYNVNYTNLPTFTSNSIGYNENKAGILSYGDNINILTACHFDIGIGVYIISVNIFYLVSANPYNFWYTFLSTSSDRSEDILCMVSPQGNYISSSFYLSSINFTRIINNDQPHTIYVKFTPYQKPNTTGDCYFDCSIVRIS